MTHTTVLVGVHAGGGGSIGQLAQSIKAALAEFEVKSFNAVVEIGAKAQSLSQRL
jgi:hypothetical protein